jgi:hypothetical protein
MNPRNEDRLHKRVVVAASKALAEKGWVSSIDVLVGMGWLSQDHVEAWRRGQAPYLEGVIQAGLGKISTAMRDLHDWAASQGLKPSRTEYLRSNQQSPLQFSKSGHPALEERYRTHWISQACAKRTREQRKDGSRKVTERLVYVPLRQSHCDSCGHELERRLHRSGRAKSAVYEMRWPRSARIPTPGRHTPHPTNTRVECTIRRCVEMEPGTTPLRTARSSG